MPKLRAVDLFCGAGGMTLGAELSGRVDVVLAVNHWRTAVLTHQENHPRTRHICARIEDMDLRSEHDLPEVDVIMGGIECTHHSVARGAAPINDQKRTSAWRVIDWIGKFRPAWCVFENVREFCDWGPVDRNGRKIKSKAGEIFTAWVQAIRAHGYHVEWKLLNSAHYGEATRRLRLFIVCRRGGSNIPFQWPAPTHGSRKEIQKDLAIGFRSRRQYERAACEIIDWSRPCPSIFDRKRPLAEKTLRRIEIGLRKFVEPFVVKLRGTGTANGCRHPLGAVTAGGMHYGLATPFIVQYHNGPDGHRRTYPFTKPLPTLDTQPRYAMAAPFILPRQGHWDSQQLKRCRSIDEPLNTITASHVPAGVVMPMVFAQGSYCNGRGADCPLPTLLTTARPWIAMPFMCQLNHGDDSRSGHRVNGVDQPLRTITTKRCDSLIYPFLTKYYGTGGARPVTAPLDTVTTKDRHGLALVHTMRELGIVDIGFRMLDVDELAAAQGFPADYVLHGTKADQIRQVGNSVCPKVMQAICGQLD